MDEIIFGLETSSSITKVQESHYMCRYRGIICEMATNNGYCKITACIKGVTSSGETDSQ